MHLILLGLGIATIGAGGVMLGYGITFNEFGLGNTLIMAGTTAITGGLIVVALAIAVRQLTRVADQLVATEWMPAPIAGTDAQPGGSGDPIALAVGSVPASPATRASPAAEEQPDQPRQPDHRPAPREPVPREPLLEPPAPPGVAPRARGAAGTMRPARSSRGEIPVVLSPRERSFDKSADPAPAEQREVARADDRAGGAPRDQPTASILKSGVIDGMAYTIYSDGSIEAELPQGTMRFTTFEELRVYLAHAN